MNRTLVAALLTGGLLLTGCSSQDVPRAASAAKVGDTSISMAELEGRVNEAAAAIASLNQGQTPAEVKALRVGENGVSLSQVNLQWLITTELMDIVAEREGIQPPADQVQAKQEELSAVNGQQLISGGIPVSAAPDIARYSVQSTLLAEKIAAAGDVNARAAAIVGELSKVATEVGVEANPRFGIFDTKTLSFTGASNDLSTPAPAPSASGQ